MHHTVGAGCSQDNSPKHAVSWGFKRLLNKMAFFFPGGTSLRPMLQRRRGVVIGRNVFIGQYVYFDELHPASIIIGDNVTIGMRTSIIAHFYWGPRRTDSGFKQIIIEDDVFVGPHCLILPGARIRKGAIVKGGTTVSREVPAKTLWGAPEAGPLAHATVPLTPHHSFETFIRGLRPFAHKNEVNEALINLSTDQLIN